jgi:hypothetical protein
MASRGRDDLRDSAAHLSRSDDENVFKAHDVSLTAPAEEAARRSPWIESHGFVTPRVRP